MSRRKPKENPQSALLGDLESIRSLLEDDDEDVQEPADADLDDIEVPVLEDIVDDDDQQPEPVPEPVPDPEPVGADSIRESAKQDSRIESAPTEPGLDDGLFRALLSDEWRNSASEILKEAREAIDEHRADWTPEETDALNDALKVRIDATMQGWMRGMVVTHMADLHETLLKALSDELTTTIDNIIEGRSETSDGE
jgi:hypothetical protein